MNKLYSKNRCLLTDQKDILTETQTTIRTYTLKQILTQ